MWTCSSSSDSVSKEHRWHLYRPDEEETDVREVVVQLTPPLPLFLLLTTACEPAAETSNVDISETAATPGLKGKDDERRRETMRTEREVNGLQVRRKLSALSLLALASAGRSACEAKGSTGSAFTTAVAAGLPSSPRRKERKK